MLLRTELILILSCVALLRQPACSCTDGEPCGYAETPISAGDPTPWGTTVGEDIAALEVPQMGAWRWHDSVPELGIDQEGVEFPAVATFVHDPETLRMREHVSGGQRVACDGSDVEVDGILTFTDEQDTVIVSIPITVSRHHQIDDFYAALPEIRPIASFSTELHARVEYDFSLIVGSVLWLEGRFLAEFQYFAQRKETETTGFGVYVPVAVFDTDPLP